MGSIVVVAAGISFLAWFATAYSPDSWHRIALFFVFIAVIVAAPLFSLLNNVRHVFLITAGVLIFLLLRLLGLREIIYPLLLAATILSVELMLRKR